MTSYALNLGSAVTLPGSGYAKRIMFDLPVRAGLTGAYFFGEGETVALTNWGGSEPNTVVGAPVWHDGYAELDGSNYIQTGVAETAAMTVLAVIKRKTTGTNVALVGNYGGTGATGVALYVASSNDDVDANTGRAGGTSICQATGNVDNWALVSITVPSSGAMTIRDHTTGTSSASAATDARVVNGVGDLRIGSFPSGNFDQPVNVAAVATYSAALSSDDLNLMVGKLRAYAALHGITV